MIELLVMRLRLNMEEAFKSPGVGWLSVTRLEMLIPKRWDLRCFP